MDSESITFLNVVVPRGSITCLGASGSTKSHREWLASLSRRTRLASGCNMKRGDKQKTYCTATAAHLIIALVSSRRAGECMWPTSSSSLSVALDSRPAHQQISTKRRREVRDVLSCCNLAHYSSNEIYLSQQPIVQLKSGQSGSLAHSKANAFMMPWTPSKVSRPPFTHICPPFPYP